MPSGIAVHGIDQESVDVEARLGICRHCGEVQVRKAGLLASGATKWSCTKRERRSDLPSRRVHRLSNHDPEALTADCAACGPNTPVKARTRRSGPRAGMTWWICMKSRSDSTRKGALKKNYDITPEDYSLLLSTQDGLCAICKTPAPKDGKPLHVDHCHTTGRIRGLLCFTCNVGLGQFGDDIQRMEDAVWYLRLYSDPKVEALV